MYRPELIMQNHELIMQNHDLIMHNHELIMHINLIMHIHDLIMHKLELIMHNHRHDNTLGFQFKYESKLLDTVLYLIENRTHVPLYIISPSHQELRQYSCVLGPTPKCRPNGVYHYLIVRIALKYPRMNICIISLYYSFNYSKIWGYLVDAWGDQLLDRYE